MVAPRRSFFIFSEIAHPALEKIFKGNLPPPSSQSKRDGCQSNKCSLLFYVYVINTCCLVGFVGDTLSRRVVHRSVYWRGTDTSSFLAFYSRHFCIDFCRHAYVCHIDGGFFCDFFLWFTGFCYTVFGLAVQQQRVDFGAYAVVTETILKIRR